MKAFMEQNQSPSKHLDLEEDSLFVSASPIDVNTAVIMDHIFPKAKGIQNSRTTCAAISARQLPHSDVSPFKESQLARFHLLEFLVRSRGDGPFFFAKESTGKPFLPSHAHLGVSISHTAGITFVGWADAYDIGVDVELESKANVLWDHRYKFLGPNERKWINYWDTPSQKHLIVPIWCLKEAVAKAIGYGLALRFSSFDALTHSDMDYLSKTDNPIENFMSIEGTDLTSSVNIEGKPIGINSVSHQKRRGVKVFVAQGKSCWFSVAVVGRTIEVPPGPFVPFAHPLVSP